MVVQFVLERPDRCQTSLSAVVEGLRALSCGEPVELLSARNGRTTNRVLLSVKCSLEAFQWWHRLYEKHCLPAVQGFVIHAIGTHAAKPRTDQPASSKQAPSGSSKQRRPKPRRKSHRMIAVLVSDRELAKDFSALLDTLCEDLSEPEREEYRRAQIQRWNCTADYWGRRDLVKELLATLEARNREREEQLRSEDCPHFFVGSGFSGDPSSIA